MNMHTAHVPQTPNPLQTHLKVGVFVYIQGHFVKKLGTIGDKETENDVLLLEHEIPHLPFSTAVLNDLPKETWSISEEVTLVCLRSCI